MRVYLESIKFAHTIFALPFALLAALIARRGALPSLREIACVVLAMVGARTFAMCVNRVADRRIDALNPRTATRALVSGTASLGRMITLGFFGAFAFLAAAALLSPIALACAPVVLVILATYSFTKRFTWLCHFWLGLCLGLAPQGAWVALRGELSGLMALLGAALAFWVAGFDIIYALQDELFDKGAALHSVPSRFGRARSLWIARLSHLTAGFLFVGFGLAAALGPIYASALGASAILMWRLHVQVAAKEPRFIEQAFFSVNGWVAVLLAAGAAVDLFLQG